MESELRRFKANLFQALAHPTRVAIVELLADGPRSAGQLIEALGLEQSNVSQHLAILRSKQVLLSRRLGNQVHYELRDPVLAEVLAVLRRYFYSHLSESVAMLRHIEASPPETNV